MYQLELVFRFEALRKAAIRRKFPENATTVITERATVKTVEGTAEKHSDWPIWRFVVELFIFSCKNLFFLCSGCRWFASGEGLSILGFLEKTLRLSCCKLVFEIAYYFSSAFSPARWKSRRNFKKQKKNTVPVGDERRNECLTRWFVFSLRNSLHLHSEKKRLCLPLPTFSGSYKTNFRNLWRFWSAQSILKPQANSPRFAFDFNSVHVICSCAR